MFDFFRMIKFEILSFLARCKRKIKCFFCNHHYISVKGKNFFGQTINTTPECSKCGKRVIEIQPWHKIEYK